MFYYANVRSICNKFNDLCAMISSFSPKIILLTETWLSSEISDSCFLLPNYSIFRFDRPTRAGGVAILTHSSISFKNVLIPNIFSSVEVCAVDVQLSIPVRLVCVYRAPNTDLAYLNSLIECLRFLFLDTSSFILCGDFNFKDISFDPPCAPVGLSSIFLEFILEEGLVQFVQEPTHKNGNVLDLVFGSDPFIMKELLIDEPLATSDHFSIRFELNVSQDHKVCEFVRFNNCDHVVDFLNHINWNFIFEDCSDSQSFWTEFSNVLNFGINNFLPKKRANNSKSFFPLSENTTNALREKKKNWQKFKRSNNLFYKRAHNRLSKICHKLVFKDRLNYENRLASDPNMKKFYNYVKSSLKRPSNIPVLKQNGCDVSDNGGKCELFNSHFCSVFTNDNNILPDFEDRTNVIVDNIVFDYALVSRALKRVSKSYSSGTDGFPSIFIKSISDSIVEPLCTLFNICFYTRKLPSCWLEANVIPIFKQKGSISSADNYRPISLTSVICKTMEQCVKEIMLNHLISNNLLSPHQHGFLPKKSTLTELLECFNDWVLALESGCLVDVIYIDFAKAFDSVVHSKLIKKCSAYGFRGFLLDFIKSFLTNRKQRVKIDDCVSCFGDVKSGVPQGSVLGPLLFLIYINDMPDTIMYCIIKLYADDSKLSSKVKKGEGSSIDLQSDLTRLFEWCDKWQLKINSSKCAVLPLGSRRITTGVSPYHIENAFLQFSSLEKDLGVHVSSDLKSNIHCAKIISKASQTMGLIFRAFSSNQKNFLLKIFKSKIRPILEYCCEVWSPWTIEYIDKIESVQRRFTKRITGLYDMSYSERLQICELEPLELRRLKRDLILTYKICHKLVSLDFNDFFVYAPVSSTRGHRDKLFPKKFKTVRTLSFFSNRVVNFWNNLPADVIESTTLSSFTAKLDKLNPVLSNVLRGRAFRDH